MDSVRVREAWMGGGWYRRRCTKNGMLRREDCIEDEDGGFTSSELLVPEIDL